MTSPITSPIASPVTSPMGALQGRHAVVTGAARGIGAAIVRVLAAEGAVVTLLGRRRDA